MIVSAVALAALLAVAIDFDAPPRFNEVGLRPAEGSVLDMTPPAFVWRPQPSEWVSSYQLAYCRRGDWKHAIVVTGLVNNVYCPAQVLEAGEWFWRVRGETPKGCPTKWSATHRFTVAADAKPFPRPSDADLISRVPKCHPRLFFTAEDIARFRKSAETTYKDAFRSINDRCKLHLRNRRLNDLSDPLRYTEDMPRLSESWKVRWQNNSSYVTLRLSAIADLAFGWRLTGNEKYGQKARDALRIVAKWDPKGASGYRYNDEAGMPYLSFFSRAYTFLWHYLTEEDRREFREMMRIRGEEVYHHIFPFMFYRPYRSHGNRAWHYLNEAALAFLGEIPEAEKWLCDSFDYAWCLHPVWGDADGGWHEGAAYWTAYMNRYVDWAYEIKNIVGINFLSKPFYSHTGDFIMYQEVPGFRGGGFADCAERTEIGFFAKSMSALTFETKNPYWAWYARKANQAAGQRSMLPYLRLMKADQTLPEGRAPDSLPTSKLFAGNGLAIMNTCLTDASNDVQVLFKCSSGRGTASHGYDAQNSFNLNAYGASLFKHAGYRDCSGSAFHHKYMHRSESCNTVTAGGDSQRTSFDTHGKLTSFSTSPEVDEVEGIVGEKAWKKGIITNFVRRIRFVKSNPAVVEIHDFLQAKEPTTFTWHLHTPESPYDIQNQHEITAISGKARATVDFVRPAGLTVSQTDAFPIPIGYGKKLVQHHLSAETSKTNEIEFLTRIVVTRNPASAR